MSAAFSDLDHLCVNTVRTLSIDAVQAADSGHPGMPLGAAPMAYVLWQRHLRHDPSTPDWPDRDRFVLSGGHGSMLLYALLHLSGYDLPLDEVRNFRQWGSRTPGHPEFGHTVGVEATTGPLGQGSANAVGMAMAERWLASHFNRPGHEIVDHFTYAIVTDGDLMEGVSAEAASLAGFLQLGKLIYLYDSNGVTLDGPASMHFSEDVGARYEAYGWHVQTVENGDEDLDAIDLALRRAREEHGRPSLIIVKTTIGYGSPAKAGSADAHGAPLGEDEVTATKRQLGWNWDEAFQVPDEARDHFHAAKQRGGEARGEWKLRFERFREEHPQLAEQWELAHGGGLPAGWDADLPRFEQGQKLATRAASGKVLNAIAPHVPWLIGGDADLGGSTKTRLDGEDSFDAQRAGRNVHFGVREHAMGAAVNGMLYHGGVRAFCATFFVFSDYMRPAVRLAALSGLPAVYVWTHDSVGVGEDGPTHQPVEHLASLRAMPGLTMIRPADANETAAAWRWTMSHRSGPVGLVLSRQGLPVLVSTEDANSGMPRGGYVLRDPEQGPPQAILIASGSEVELAVAAHERLAREGVRTRVVSLPSWELFDEQDRGWRDEVLPREVEARVAIEAGTSLGWHRWVGERGAVIALDRFGASAPGDRVREELGFTVQRVVDTVRAVLS